MKLRLRRKKKQTPQPLNDTNIREIIKEELALHTTETDEKKAKENERDRKLARIHSLPRSKRMQLLRYMERRKKK